MDTRNCEVCGKVPVEKETWVTIRGFGKEKDKISKGEIDKKVRLNPDDPPFSEDSELICEAVFYVFMCEECAKEIFSNGGQDISTLVPFMKDRIRAKYPGEYR